MADYKNIISFIKLREGGLSSATTDTASRSPSNCGNGSNGKPYHTNKGVTWTTFTSLASKLGYSATCANFMKMPDDIWGKIYKYGYWNPMLGDEIKNQAVANVFVEMAWGSGVGGATTALKKFFTSNYNKSFANIGEMVKYVNELESDGKSSDLFEKLNTYRKYYYKSLGQPANLTGWLNRLNAFYIVNKPYAISKNEKKIGILAILLAIIGGLYLYKKLKK
jgi:lysozyme family protein